MVQNLRRAPILRGRWWHIGEPSHWMLGGSTRYITQFRNTILADNASADEITVAMGSNAIAEDYQQINCEYFQCPGCQGRI